MLPQFLSWHTFKATIGASCSISSAQTLVCGTKHHFAAAARAADFEKMGEF